MPPKHVCLFLYRLGMSLNTLKGNNLVERITGYARAKDANISRYYNEFRNLWAAMEKERKEGRKPAGAIMPVDVPRDTLWNLDVDDPIWNDVGLGWSEPGVPLGEGDGNGEDRIQIPRWMGDDAVRCGMRAFGLKNRATEEKIRLCLERNGLQVEAQEVWSALHYLLEGEVDTDYSYQWQVRRQRTFRTIVKWSTAVMEIPGDGQSESWGPTWEEMRDGVGTLPDCDLQELEVLPASPMMEDEVMSEPEWEGMGGSDGGGEYGSFEDEVEDEGNFLTGEDYGVEDMVTTFGLLDTM